LFDIEATGLDVRKHEMIELAAILLDKKTLRPKKSFSSLIRPANWKQRSRAAMAVNKISWARLKDAPRLKEVMTQFSEEFSAREVILAYYAGNLDVPFLAAAYEKAGRRFSFDYHTLDIWGLFYVYMAQRRKLASRKSFAGFSLEDIARHFKIAVPKNRHSALADCELEAEVLRAVLKALRN